MFACALNWTRLRSLRVHVGTHSFLGPGDSLKMHELLPLLAAAPLRNTLVEFGCACGELGPAAEASQVSRCLPLFSRLEQLQVGFTGTPPAAAGDSSSSAGGAVGAAQAPIASLRAMLAPLSTLRLLTPGAYSQDAGGGAPTGA